MDDEPVLQRGSPLHATPDPEPLGAPLLGLARRTRRWLQERPWAAWPLLSGFILACFLVQPDVRLHVRGGEVVGWVYVERTYDGEGGTWFHAHLGPLAQTEGPVEFDHYLGWASSALANGERLEAACRSRGVTWGTWEQR